MQTSYDILHNHGLKATKPRIYILDLIRGLNQKHLNVDDIYCSLLSKNMKINYTTIYRILSQFTTSGILKRCTSDKNKTIYELCFTDNHDHFECIACRSLIEFKMKPEIFEEFKKIMKENNFVFSSYTLYAYGYCFKHSIN